MKLFFDTSALIKFFHEEDGTARGYEVNFSTRKRDMGLKAHKIRVYKCFMQTIQG